MIRTFQPDDIPALIKLIQSNTPEFFDPSEEADFLQYLQEEAEDYFVFEIQGKIVACGGIHVLTESKSARISWGMVHPNNQGQGIGKKLTRFRINEIKRRKDVNTIFVRTSQKAFKFYEKLGFVLKSVEKDYWAKGLDLYYMDMKAE